MNIPIETLDREVRTILSLPRDMQERVVEGILRDPRLREWDKESIDYLISKTTTAGVPMDEKKSLQLVTSTRVTQAIAPYITSDQNYAGPFLGTAGRRGRLLYNHSWKDAGNYTQQSRHKMLTLSDIQKELSDNNIRADWRTKTVPQEGLSLGRDNEGYYVTIVTGVGKSGWYEDGRYILRPDEKLYFSERGIRKFFSTCVNGGINKLNALELSLNLNRKMYSDPNTPYSKDQLDSLFEGILGTIQFNFFADNLCGYNQQYNRLNKNHQLLTFVGKNSQTGLFRRYVGHVTSERYNPMSDVDYIEHLLSSCPDIASAPVIDIKINDNVTKMRLLDGTQQDCRDIMESGYTLNKSYRAFDIGNSQNSSSSAYLNSSLFRVICWNGMYSSSSSGDAIRIRKTTEAQKVRGILSGGLQAIRLGSQNILSGYNELNLAQVGDFSLFLDAARDGFKSSTDKTVNITDGVLDKMKENINEATNNGEMYSVSGHPTNMGCTAQRIVDAVTFTANEYSESGQLLLADHMRGFGFDIQELANSRRKEYALSEDRWGGCIDSPPDSPAYL